jgi:PAS domain-containing protein
MRLERSGWPAPRVRMLQIDELFRFAAVSAAFSFLGALLTLGVLFQVGVNRTAAALWFFAATGINVARAFIIFFYRRREPNADPSQYADAFVVTNFAAGVLFGVLGTVLFPAGPAYAQLFVLMVIICFVAGSVTAYAPVRFAHAALSIPATFPTAFYLFFVRDGMHWFAGLAALFFCLAIVYYARQLHRHLEGAFIAQIERDDLLALQQALQDKVRLENRELAHRVAVRGVRAEDAAVRAERLESMFHNSPLPQFECDASGHVVTANPAAARTFAVPVEAMVGEPIAVFVSGISVHAAADAAPHSVPAEARLPAGQAHACTASLTPWALPGGPRGFAVLLSGLPSLEPVE